MGSIPAYAGETSPYISPLSTVQVDPRVCGGDCWLCAWRSLSAGRSPRMRGRPHNGLFHPDRGRSIPAYAGETVFESVSYYSPGVDPRVCGGDRSVNPNRLPGRGRSPRMRGRHQILPLLDPSARSIPAYAGETLRSIRGPDPTRVDPRVCGGDPVLRNTLSASRGRSPRMRGRQAPTRKKVIGVRSIPAYAGETLTGNRLCQRAQVDPRVCGGD